jgi:uncharacterized protein involved in response to NO
MGDHSAAAREAPQEGNLAKAEASKRKAQPRYRDRGGPALLTAGFRPFFLFAAIWAIAALLASMAMIFGILDVPLGIGPGDWHFHEMLFGFVVAAIAGFLLTAIPNWTGSMPLQGPGLGALVGLWLLGRIAMTGILPLPGAAVALVDVAFLLVFALVIFREIRAGGNWRNLQVVAVVTLLFVANGSFHVAALGYWDFLGPAKRLAVSVVILLVTLIGGRIIPSFTRNWLAKRNDPRLPAAFGSYDKIAILGTAVALAAWVVAPSGQVTGLLLAVVAVLNFGRLARWRPLATLSEPLLWVLHLGYLWMPTGLALASLAALLGWPNDIAALHALAMGVMGTMILAVMGRVAKGHTGRPLTAGPLLTVAYVILGLSVLARIAAAIFPDYSDVLLNPAALGWCLAFALFLVSCGPYLVARRPPAKSF